MTSKKKIVMISRRFSPSVGGVEKHIQHVCDALPKSYSVTLLTEKYSEQLRSEEVIKKVRVYRFSFPKTKYIGLFVIWLQLLKYIRVLYVADVIHIHDVFIWFLPYRLIFFWKPVFVTYHGWEGKYPIRLISKLQKKLAYFLSSGSIAVGSYIGQFYSISPTRTIFGAVEMKHNATVLKNKTILFLGRLDPDTGLLLFLKFLSLNKAHLHKYNVIFCGEGSLRVNCEKYGVVTGFVDPIPLLRKANICIASGYLSVFESLQMACYTVVIANNKARRYIFSDTPFASRIHVVRSEQGLKKILTNYINNPAEFKNARKENSKWASAYTWSKVSKEYLGLWSHN
jgi:glycosyltransferase involved in cell wall biosynthesis